MSNSMSPVLKALADTIIDIARNEDAVLRRVRQGIFHMPELAFVHAVGRAIAARAHEIFATPNVRWLPEVSIGGAHGPTDLVFEVEGQKAYAFEFKQGANAESYVRDLRKLASLDAERYERIFCALIDTWPKEIDPNPRITAVVKSGVPVERLVEHFDFFATLDSRFKNQVCCVVGLWRVAPDYVLPAANVDHQQSALLVPSP
jgi:hypothetical protein